MATILDALVVTLGLDASKFRAGQKTASADLTRTKEDANRAAKEIEASGKQAAEFFTRLRNEAIALFAIFVGASGLKDFIQGTVRAEASTGRMAKNLGMATEQLSAWEGAAQRAGGSADGMDGTMRGLTQQFQQFALTGESAVVPYFRALGVQLSDTTGQMRPMSDIMLDLADRFQRMTPQRANAFGAALGMDQGTINLLILGRKAVQDLLAEQQRLGVIREKDAQAGIKMQNSLLDLRQAMSRIGMTILTDLSPYLVGVMGHMTKWIEKNKDWLEQKIEEKIKQFGDWLKAIDWDKVGAGIESFITGLVKLLDAIGGPTRAIEWMLGLWAVSKLAPILFGVASLGTAIGTGLTGKIGLATAASTTLLARLGAIGLAAGLIALLYSLKGDTDTPEMTPEERRKSLDKNVEEFKRTHPGSVVETFGEMAQRLVFGPIQRYRNDPSNSYQIPYGRPPAQPGSFQMPGGYQGSSADFYSDMRGRLYAAAVAGGLQNPSLIADLGAAQSVIETGSGKHVVGNNYFGIKSGGGVGTGSVSAGTSEYGAGGQYQTQASFAAFGGMDQSAAGYIEFLKRNPRYATLLAAGDRTAALAALQASGYATDPDYASKVGSVLNSRFASGPDASTGRVHAETHIGELHIHTQADNAPGTVRALSAALQKYQFVPQANTGLA